MRFSLMVPTTSRADGGEDRNSHTSRLAAVVLLLHGVKLGERARRDAARGVTRMEIGRSADGARLGLQSTGGGGGELKASPRGRGARGCSQVQQPNSSKLERGGATKALKESLLTYR